MTNGACWTLTEWRVTCRSCEFDRIDTSKSKVIAAAGFHAAEMEHTLSLMTRDGVTVAITPKSAKVVKEK